MIAYLNMSIFKRLRRKYEFKAINSIKGKTFTGRYTAIKAAKAQ
jgi:hypothetical protein